MRTEWAKLDHVVIAAAIHQWRRCSVTRVCTPSLAIFPTRFYELDSNLANLEVTVEVG